MPNVKINDINIPTTMYKGKICFDWEHARGTFVPFIYGDTQGVLKIIATYKNGKGDWRLITQFGNEEPHDILSYHLINGKLESCIGINTKKFKYNVGQRIVDNDGKRDITIIAVYNKKHKSFSGKHVSYQCNVCGYVAENIREESINIGAGCPACEGKIVVVGRNDIPTTAPELVDFFIGGVDEARKYSKSSNKRLKFKCPDCGTISDKYISIDKLHRRTSIGCPCGDKGISLPEKFAFYIFRSLVGSGYKREVYSSELFGKGNGSFRYDGTISLKNPEISELCDIIIVETHGKQHYKDNRFSKHNAQSLEDVQRNDAQKKELALNAGILPENYIVMDCRKTSLQYMKDRFIESRIFTMLGIDESSIDWADIYKKSVSSYERKILDYANKNTYESIKSIAKKYEVGLETVRKVLKDNNAFDIAARDPQAHKNKPVMVVAPESKRLRFTSLYEACDKLDISKSDIQKITTSIANGTEYQGLLFSYLNPMLT